MARSLEFQFQDNRFACEIQTVDRSKLYGSVSIETLDQEERRCQIATLAIDGKTLVPNGGTASGYVNNDGDWIARNDLVAVDLDGNPLAEVESTFKQTVMLDTTITVDQFLDHSIRLVYLLKPEATLSTQFSQSLAKGDIYQFAFSYRGGVDTDPAFILMAEDETVWMLVTEENNVQFVGLEQAAICEINGQVDTNEGEDEDDELDFGML